MPIVAPLAGAWIETAAAASLAGRLGSRPSRARGSKQATLDVPLIATSRAPRGRVDRNRASTAPSSNEASRAPRGRVDRNEANNLEALAVQLSRPSRARGSKQVLR